MSDQEPKWIECNIVYDPKRVKNPNQWKEFMHGTVFSLVDKVRAGGGVESWHYFAEPGPSIRLRFFTLHPDAAKLILDKHLKISENRSFGSKYVSVVRHYYGKHGTPYLQYEGEEDFWNMDWPAAMKNYERMAEMSRAVIEAGYDHANGRGLETHATRYVHLLLNQLGYNYGSEAELHAMMQVDSLIAYLNAVAGRAEEAMEMASVMVLSKKPEGKKRRA